MGGENDFPSNSTSVGRSCGGPVVALGGQGARYPRAENTRWVNDATDLMDAWWRHTDEAVHEAANCERDRQCLGRGYKYLGKRRWHWAFQKVVLDHRVAKSPGKETAQDRQLEPHGVNLRAEGGSYSTCTR